MLAHPIRRTSILLNLLAVLVLASGGTIAAQPATGGDGTGAGTPRADAAFRASPVTFIENTGQWPDAARFQVWGAPVGALWLAEDAIWLTVVVPGDRGLGTGNRRQDARRPPEHFSDVGAPSTELPQRGVNVRLSFVGADLHQRIEPFDPLDTVVSYFIGNEPDQWRPDVPVWGGVRYVDLYPGVDLEITSEAGRMVQRLAARPGADLSAVRLRVEGADAVAVEGDVLHLSTATGAVAWPLLRTDGLKVGGLQVEGFEVEDPQRGGVQAFEVAAPFAPANLERRSAVIYLQSTADNPAELLYGTFLGGDYSDSANSVAVDGLGSVYLTGATESFNFPTIPGAFDSSFSGYYEDAFVTKLNSAGSGLAYATFLGGTDDDGGDGIAVDGNGAAYVTGWTRSDDFPTTSSSYDPYFNGRYEDGFVVRLDARGSHLTYATFMGGKDNDSGDAIAVDVTGCAYVIGHTWSSDFPTTLGAFDASYNSGLDAFVAKLNSGGSGLVYATFLGGKGGDWGHAIAVDRAGSAYMTGETWSSDFPTTPGALDPTYNGGYYDAFVAKLDPVGSGLAYATYLGGSESDFGNAIAVDDEGYGYVAGDTGSSNFPYTPNGFDRSHGGYLDAFVAKLDLAGSRLTYATFLGTSGFDYGRAIAVDRGGSAYIAGWTGSVDFPTTPDAFDTSLNSDHYHDTFAAKLDSTGSRLAYATFLGGGNDDSVCAITVNTAGSAYVTGWTKSSNFPTTPGTFDPSYNGGNEGDAFVAKLAMGRVTYPPATYLPQVRLAPPADPCRRYEPNDTLSTAWGPLTNGGTIEASLCSGDPDDYFYLDLAAATTLVFDLAKLPAGTDYDLVLYSAAGSQLAESRSDGTTPEHIAAAVSAGHYYVRVYPFQGRSSQAYRLTAAW